MAAAETKLQRNAADKHDASQRARTAGVKAEQNRRYNNERSVCGKHGKVSRARRGKVFMARATARSPSSSSSSSSSSNPQAVPLSIPGVKPPG